ncbi:MAG: penicillin acylase family protein [Candidatus Dormibacteria bacterium]
MAVLLAMLPVLSVAPAAGADVVPQDLMHAVNIVPPGQGGSFNAATFAQNQLLKQLGQPFSYGPNYADQLPLYRDWKYKPFQFEQSGTATHPGGRTDVTVYRDQYGVPQIYAGSEVAMTYAMGYTMAEDRLFQMEAFRRVGHGTLAELTGAGALPMDINTRRVSEGSAARLAELAAAPQDIRDRAEGFTAGINQLMVDKCGPSVLGQRTAAQLVAFSATCPAEFGLLNDPPRDWTNDDALAFGEYAARNFGEFDSGELTAAKTYVDLVAKLGQAAAEKAFNDLYPVDVPSSPYIIPAADGIFLRHTGAPVPAGPGSAGSSFANHDPSLLPPPSSLALGAVSIDAQKLVIRKLQQQLGIPRWGSNAIVMNGSRTASHNPILYSGPQTGWAVPGFFWEVEVHTPQRDTRGVTVPTIPLLVIGRNRDMGWSVTSAEGTNATTFVEKLTDPGHYMYNGIATAFADKHLETINCNNPPTVLTDLIGGTLDPPCPSPLTPTQVTVYRTVHGPALADPTPDNLLFTRETTVDHRFVKTLSAWDAISMTHTARDFGNVLSNHFLGFNFFYADTHGDIAYFHTGRYPIWASNIDPNLPQPGTGAYDWRGEEKYSDNPHVINPSTGFLVNWNNKPARGWWSPATLGAQNWGSYQQAVQLADITGARTNWTFDEVGQIPRLVAYTDHRARALNPYLVAALQGQPGQLGQLHDLMAAYDLQRSDRGGGRMGPATVFFDRWLEYLNRDLFSGLLGTDCRSFLDYTIDKQGSTTPCGDSATKPAHSISIDNTGAAAHKFDQDSQDVLLRGFRGEAGGPLNQFNVFGAAGATQATRVAAREAADELSAAQGSNISAWSEPVEQTCFSPQGAGSVPCYGPLQNRGSYGQVIEPLAVSAASVPASVVGGTPTTSRGAALRLGPLLGLLGLIIAVGGLRSLARRPKVAR